MREYAKKTFLIYTSLVGVFTFILISCNVTGGDCGPFDEHFEVTDFQTENVKVTALDSTEINLNPLEEDTISYSDFAINMTPVTELYSSNFHDRSSFNFISTAYACSPPIPTSEERITDIEIYSNKPFNDEYSSDQNLAEIFDVFVLYRGKEYKLYDLVEFLEDKPTVPDRITLLLTSAPSSPQPMQFTIKYFQDGRELDEYNFTTNSVTITNKERPIY